MLSGSIIKLIGLTGNPFRLVRNHQTSVQLAPISVREGSITVNNYHNANMDELNYIQCFTPDEYLPNEESFILKLENKIVKHKIEVSLYVHPFIHNCHFSFLPNLHRSSPRVEEKSKKHHNL